MSSEASSFARWSVSTLTTLAADPSSRIAIAAAANAVNRGTCTAPSRHDHARFFSSRDDDVIVMAGYRIGPFEVESVLLTHPNVAEAAAIGVPDELRGEVLEAFVVLAPGTDATPALTVELQQLVKTKFAAHAFPRSIHYVDELPKTPSGKIQRFVLRAPRTAEMGTA